MQSIHNPPFIWLISGCSSGFVGELTLKTLSMGDFVGVSSRKIEDVEDICNQYPETSVAITLDVTKKQDINQSIETITKTFGGLDVLVNNAGYGYLADIEEGEDEEVRRLFEATFVGAVEITKDAWRGMRSQKFGRIIKNSSQAGNRANQGTGNER